MTAVRNFASEEHEKAWLIVTASNTCKDELRRFKRKFQYIRNCLKSENSVSAGGGRDIRTYHGTSAKVQRGGISALL